MHVGVSQVRAVRACEKACVCVCTYVFAHVGVSQIRAVDREEVGETVDQLTLREPQGNCKNKGQGNGTLITCGVQWNLCIVATSFIEGWPLFQGVICTDRAHWDQINEVSSLERVSLFHGRGSTWSHTLLLDLGHRDPR